MGIEIFIQIGFFVFMLVILIGVPVVMALVLWYNNRRGLLTDVKHLSRYGNIHMISINITHTS
jgi:hypothetical protein